jgi:hypothetical protein
MLVRSAAGTCLYPVLTGTQLSLHLSSNETISASLSKGGTIDTLTGSFHHSCTGDIRDTKSLQETSPLLCHSSNKALEEEAALVESDFFGTPAGNTHQFRSRRRRATSSVTNSKSPASIHPRLGSLQLLISVVARTMISTSMSMMTEIFASKVPVDGKFVIS